MDQVLERLAQESGAAGPGADLATHTRALCIAHEELAANIAVANYRGNVSVSWENTP